MIKAKPEDLLDTVVAADALRRQARGLSKTRAAHALQQKRVSRDKQFTRQMFNLLGHLWAWVMISMPAPARRSFIQWVNTKMGNYSPPLSPELPRRIEETIHLAEQLKQKTGQWPALMVMTSHPDTEGAHQWLRFELLRQGLQIADALVEARQPGAWYPTHPRCFLAIDPFALDTVSAPVGGFYAAWMHRIYIAWDRQPSGQSWLQKHILLRRSGYARIAWKLLEFLRADTPILMAMGGGLPYNARLLYGAREFVQELPIKRWTLSKRDAQLELMRILMKPEENVWPADQGTLTATHIDRIRESLLKWGLAPNDVEMAIQQLQIEFKQSVPFRKRLFRVLAKRVVARGKPVILVGITHQDASPHVRIGAPVELPGSSEDIPDFAQRFSTAHF